MMEAELLRKAQRGDRTALEEVFRREWPPIYATVYRAIPDHAEAEDLTQEVFFRALRALDHYEPTSAPFRTYLTTIARNLIRDRWRRRGPRLVDLDQAQGISSGAAGPEDFLLASEAQARLHQLLAYLPEDQRAVIQLRILEERPTAEVAALMGRSASAVRQLQYRALSTMRTQIRKEAPR